MKTQISLLDGWVIAIYLIGIVGIGLWAGMRQRWAKRESTGYFLASHSLKWPAIGLALFATNISCVHLVSLAQAGYDQGLLMGNFEWMAAFTLVLLSLVFVPFYLRSKVATLPDFLERRYSRECRDWLAMVSMVAAIIFHIAFPLVTGWVVLHGVFGIDKWTCILLVCSLTAIYTVVGGLAAVVITEMVQAIVLLGGAMLITWFAWHKVGGWHGMVETLQVTGEMTKLSLLRPASVDPEFPWYAIFLGYPVLGIWYFCADQTIVQRVLGAKDENHARIGPLFCAAIKVLPLFIFVLPGLLFFAIIQQNHLPAPHDTKEVYGLMIQTLLPHGLLGIMAAALMAALMGNLASAANSTATLFSCDIWKRFRPNTSDHQLVWIGRIASLAAFVLGIGLVPLLDRYESIFSGLNDIIAHLAPPITCVFLVGVLWPAASARSAKWTMWIGSALGVTLYTLKTLHKWQPGWMDWTPHFVYKTPFMMMTFYMFVACLVLQIVLTFCFPKLSHEDPEQLYWKHPLDCIRLPGWPGLGDYRFLAALTVITFIALYILFR
ncbi:MAG: sodium:solute symporter [Verrucomicrobia bacterium]|nr:MAG: sodium:solute symporter [Verrucomicrobiota bacterium]